MTGGQQGLHQGERGWVWLLSSIAAVAMPPHIARCQGGRVRQRVAPPRVDEPDRKILNGDGFGGSGGGSGSGSPRRPNTMVIAKGKSWRSGAGIIP